LRGAGLLSGRRTRLAIDLAYHTAFTALLAWMGGWGPYAIAAALPPPALWLLGLVAKAQLWPMGYAASSFLAAVLLQNATAQLLPAAALLLYLAAEGLLTGVVGGVRRGAAELVILPLLAPLLTLIGSWISYKFSSGLLLPELPNWFPLYLYTSASVALLSVPVITGSALADVLWLLSKLSLAEHEVLRVDNPAKPPILAARIGLLIIAVASLPLAPLVTLAYIIGRVLEHALYQRLPRRLRGCSAFVTLALVLAALAASPHLFTITISGRGFVEYVERLAAEWG